MSHRKITAFLAASICSLALAGAAQAGTPYSQATVTRTENKVSYGTVKGDRSDTRPAEPQDVVKAMNFLLSESESRAELKYDDGTIVRIGQNTIFTFEANSRTLSLKKGTFVFFIPKGQGGGTIKTPSLTAAITGTCGKVSENIIAFVAGSGVIKPTGEVVNEGEFARRNPDGSITIGKMDEAQIWAGKLMTFNGPLPGMPERLLRTVTAMMPDLGTFDSLERVINSPSGINHYFPNTVVTRTVQTPITPDPITPKPITPVSSTSTRSTGGTPTPPPPPPPPPGCCEL